MFVILTNATGTHYLVAVNSLSINFDAKENKYFIRSGGILFYIDAAALTKSLATEYPTLKEAFEALVELESKSPSAKPKGTTAPRVAPKARIAAPVAAPVVPAPRERWLPEVDTKKVT